MTESATSRVADDDFSFTPVTRETLSSQIRDRLLERITSGALEPGARVPSERSLSEQFGVARTSVREAMQGLLSIGVVVRRGNRSYVAEKLPDLSFDEVDDRKQFIAQLFETRRLLEVPMVELAAQRASEAERVEIAEIADEFHADMSLDAFRDLDRRFHTALSTACGNPLLVEVYGKVMARLFRSEGLQSLLYDEANRGEVDKIVGAASDQHGRLAAAVAAGDVEVARVESVAHLEAVERSLIDRLM
ncbi:MAG: FadR/GntR family transcriptional regulator [Ilumatobacter sp.]|uniref:FadR/GntR family transcriptional regulator n=1 Tax=Ilumatobacter sp. TaxID=1967498 RepID=UPI003C728D55